MSQPQNLLFEAALRHYEAEEAEAKAILSVYLSNPVAIGEHPDLLAEIKKYAEKLDAAQGILETLKKNFVKDEDDTELILDHEE